MTPPIEVRARPATGSRSLTERARAVSSTLLLFGLLVTACGGAAPLARSPSPTPETPLPATPSPATPPVTPSPATPLLATPSATAVALACTAQSQLGLWSTLRLAWQVIVVPAQLASLSSVGPEVASDAGGILLFGATAPADLGQELSRLESTAPGGIAPFVMSDVEGGDVERAANLLGAMPSARQLAQTMTPAQIQAFALAAGRRMLAIGITVDLAPVMDLDAGYGPTANDPDGSRSFSDNPQVAAADASAFAAGLAAAGVVPVAKHFPGLHGAGDNTDMGPAQTSPWSALQEHGLVPFKAAIDSGVPAVMLSNASVPGLSSLPSSISPQVVAALRDQLGFKGLILTDSLTAGAIADIGLTVPEAATAALIAGADMVVYNGASADVAANARGTAAAIEAAVASGRLPRAQLIDSVDRVLAAKHVDLCAGAPHS